MPNNYNYAIEQAVYSTKAKGLEELLQAGGVSLEGITITYNGKQYVFSAATPEMAERFAQDLEQFFKTHELTALPIKYESPATLLEQELLTSTCSDDTFKKVCLSAFTLLQSQLSYTTHPSQKHIEMAFPPAMKAIYSQMFAQLRYQHITMNSEGNLVFNMQSYMREKADEGLVILQDGHTTSLFLDEQRIQEKPVYMMTTEVDAEHVRVQPFFQAPSSEVPACRFIIDASGSMGSNLASVRQSMWELAEVFFALYPDAPLTIQQFTSRKPVTERVTSSESNLWLTFVGRPSYTSAQKDELQQALLGIRADGTTPLIELTQTLVTGCVDTDIKGINTIVFTDGEPTDNQAPDDKSPSLASLLARIERDPTDRMQVRLTTNKFSIISCGATQPPLLQAVCKQFDSVILDVKDAQFTTASNSTQFLGDFLQFRDLLTCNTLITETDLGSAAHKDFIRCHGSGQFVAALPLTYERGATVSFRVENSRGDKIAEATVEPKGALTLSTNTLNSSSSQPSTSQPSVGTSNFSFVGGTRVVHPPIVESSSPAASQLLVTGPSSPTRPM